MVVFLEVCERSGLGEFGGSVRVLMKVATI